MVTKEPSTTPLSKDDIPQEFLCPITCEIMIDPHINIVGHTYEKYAIEQWLASHHTDPMTNAKLSNKILIPNHTLRKQIQSFIEKNNIKVRSNKCSPFKYLLRLLRIHASQNKAIHTSSNLLKRYVHLFVNNDNIKLHKINKEKYDNKQYKMMIDRYLNDWNKYSKQLEAKWIDILAKIIFIKERIYDFNSMDDSDCENDEETIKKNGQMDIFELFSKHIIKSLISIKTSLREIVSIEEKVQFLLTHFFQFTDINAFIKQKHQRLQNMAAENEEKKSEDMNMDNMEVSDDGNGGFFDDFEDDFTAFSMIAGALIGGNCCGSTGAALGSVAGPVGTAFGAAIGFYVGAIAGSAPSMMYGLYVETEKIKLREVDRMWKLIYFGFKKYANWIQKEKNEFDVCDKIFVDCMQSILQCVDHENVQNEEKMAMDEEEEENDFVYKELDMELVETWQYEISRIIPVLQECLVKAE